MPTEGEVVRAADRGDAGDAPKLAEDTRRRGPRHARHRQPFQRSGRFTRAYAQLARPHRRPLDVEELVRRAAAPPRRRPGGGASITWHRGAGTLDILVVDEGRGLATNANLFVPFFTTKPTGNGIGSSSAARSPRQGASPGTCGVQRT